MYWAAAALVSCAVVVAVVASAVAVVVSSAVAAVVSFAAAGVAAGVSSAVAASANDSVDDIMKIDGFTVWVTVFLVKQQLLVRPGPLHKLLFVLASV